MDKIYKQLIANGIATSMGSVGALISKLSLSKSLLVILASNGIMAPLILKKENEIIDKITLRKIREKHYIMQTKFVGEESNVSEKIYTDMTFSFFEKIEEHLIKENIFLDDESTVAINQFIYMINANYFDKIKDNYKKINREKLIDLVLEQITFYLKRTGKNTFSHKDVEEVLNGCIFINDSLKKKIKLEFIDSRISYFFKNDYAIIRNDIDNNNIAFDYKEKKKEDILKHPQFNIYDQDDYKTVIEAVGSNAYLNSLGDATNLEWDLDTLMVIITLIITKFRKRLCEEDNDFTNAKLVSYYVYNVFLYALANGKSSITCFELISTFKSFEYFSLPLKKDILDYLNEKMVFQVIEEPIRNNKGKILQFPRR